jgi:hypothetical protein
VAVVVAVVAPASVLDAEAVTIVGVEKLAKRIVARPMA